MGSVYSAAAFAVLSVLAQGAFGQGLTITNIQVASSQPYTGSSSYYFLRASVQNTGAARTSLVATVTSPNATMQPVQFQDNLHFSAVPSGATVQSLDTVTILADDGAGHTTTPNFALLQWSFAAPFAVAGPNQTAAVGSTITLNAGGSTNPSGQGFLSYQWTFVSRPPGTSAVIRNANDVLANFTVDVLGTWILRLTVTNGFGTDTATISISTNNTLPVANAGSNQTVSVGATVQLNGSGSSDADGDPLTYQWTLTSKPSGSTAVLSNASIVNPTFQVDKGGTYIAQLVVSDGKGNSVPSTVTINTTNTAPVANAGTNQVVNVGSTVQLNGAGSTDVDGDTISYQWSLITRPSGSSAALSGAALVNPTFVADLAGTYVAQLVVSDGKVNSNAATVTITTGNVQPPTANAGPNQTVKHGSLVQLNGSGVDPQSRPLTYQWSLITKPAGSTATLSATNISNPTFTADLLGTYVAQLFVNNGQANSQPATVTITTTNTAPVANAGPNQTAPVGSVVTLNGGGSSDADGDALTYSWSMSSKPAQSNAVLSGASSQTPTFVPDQPGTYVAQLIVSDQFTSSQPSTVTITATSSAITLTPDPLNLTNAAGTMTVTLPSPAPVGGQVMTLASEASSVATVPASVTVPEGATTTTFLVTPVSVGSTRISATASGQSLRPGIATVNVSTPAIGVSLSASVVGLTRQLTGTVTLSAPAPTGGVSVAVSASPAGIVSITGSPVNIAAGGTTGTFTVTGVAQGSATVSATAPGYTTGSAQVQAALLGQINVERGVSLAPGQTKTLAVTLATPAPVGGVTITLVSSDTSKVTVQSTVTILAGDTAPASPPSITGVNFGTANITASSPGLTGDTAPVTVGSAFTFSPTSLTLGTGATQNFTLLLSGVAPSAVTVNLSSSNTSVATVPATVTITQGTSSVQVPVTAVNSGTTTITASVSGGSVTSTSGQVTVSAFGSLSMPLSTTLAIGQQSAVNVSISSAAGAGGVTVQLASSDTSKVTLSQATAFIPQGATQPTAQPTMTAVGPGVANINATAPGYLPATQSVTVSGVFTLSPSTMSIPSGTTQNLTLTLNAPAPAGGLIANLASNNTNVATVPSTVTIPGGASNVSVPVTAIIPGNAVIAATASGVTQSTANITVVNGGNIQLTQGIQVQPGNSATLQITLPTPAPVNTSIALVSSDPSKVSLSTNSVVIAAGATQPAIPPQVTGVNFGSATITATDALGNYTQGTTTVLVNAVLSFLNSSVTVNPGSTVSATLTLSVPAPAGGLLVNLAIANTGVATATSAITIPQNSGGVQFLITGVANGTTTLTATPAVSSVAPATLTINVGSGGGGGGGGGGTINVPASTTVTAGSSTPFTVTVSPAPASNLVINLSSSDTLKATVSPSSVTILAGQTSPANQPQVLGVASGTSTITASSAGSGYTSGTGTVTVNGAGQIALSPGTASVPLNGNTTLTVTLPSAAPAGGTLVNLSSSSGSVATTPASITIGQGSTTGTFQVNAVSTGTATITAAAAGFGQATSTITVTAGVSIILPSNFVVGPGETKAFPVTLATPATTPTTVALASSDPAKLTFSQANLFFNTGSTTPSTPTNVTGVAAGTVTVTGSGSGVNTASTSVVVGFSMSFNPNSVSIVGTSTQNLVLTLSSNTPSNLTVNLSSSATGIATVPSSVTIPAGSATANVPVTGVTPGTATITATGSGVGSTQATVTVNSATAISIPANTTLGLGVQQAFAVTLPSPAGPGGVTVNLASSDTSKVTVTSSVFIGQGQTQPAAPAQVTGVNAGSVTITATANGYNPATGAVTVTATVTWRDSVVNINPGQNFLAALILSGPAPLAGLTVNFASSNPNVAFIRDSITFYPDGSSFTTVNVLVSGLANGTATITASGVNVPAATMTVNVGSGGGGGGGGGGTMTLAPSSQSITAGNTGNLLVTLSSAAPAGGAVINLSSSNTSAATVQSTVTVPAGQTTANATVTGVAAGNATITATNATYGTATASVTVTSSGGGGGGGGGALTFNPSAVNMPAGGSQTITVNIPSPAASNLTVTLSSNNPGVATVPNSVTIAAGASSANVQITGGGTGSATITASASGFTNGTANVTVTPAGTISVPGSLDIMISATVPYLISLPSPAPAGGLTVQITSSDPGRLSFPSATVQIAPGQTQPSSPVLVTGVTTGDYTVTVSAPGYGTATTAVRVFATFRWRDPVVTIAPGGNFLAQLILSASAPWPPFGVTANFTSSNPSVASIRDSVTFYADGSEFTSVNVLVTAGSQGTALIHASGINIPDVVMTVNVGSGGALTITTASLPNGTVGTPYSQTLSLVNGTSPFTWALTGGTLPAGLSLAANTGVISGTPSAAVTNTPLTFRVTDSTSPTAQTATVNLTLTINSSGGGGGGGGGGGTMTLTPATVSISGATTQNATLTLSTPAPAGGLTVNLSSNNTSVATVPATVTVAANATTATVPVTGVSNGSATITATAANYGSTTANVTVSGISSGGNAITLPQNLVIAPGDLVTFPVILSSPAAEATFINLSSSDPSKVSLSQSSIFINQGQTQPALQPKATGIGVGSSVITATTSAAGLSTVTTTVRVGLGLTFTPPSATITGAGVQNLTLSLSSAPTSSLTVNLASSNTGVATVPPSVTFTAGSVSATVPVTGVGAGTAVITASGSGIPDTTANITVVSPGTLSVQSATIALGQTSALNISLSTPAPAGGLTVALSSNDTSKVTVPASVTIPAGQTAPASAPQATAVNLGSATITATAPSGYSPGTGTITVNATLSWGAGTLTVGQGQQGSATLNLSATAPAGGVTVNLSSSNTAAATVPATVTIPAGSNSATVPVTGVAAGSSTISASGGNMSAVTLAVTVGASVSITTNSLPSGQLLQPYSQSVAATGGTSPYTWAITNGTLPAGLNFSTTTGAITGTPTATANVSLTFSVTDSSPSPQTATKTLTLAVTQTPTAIVVNSGSGQSASTNGQFANPLTARVTDVGGNPVPNVTVTFAAPGSGASASFAGGANTATTNASGIATSAVLTANGTTGTYTVTATASGIATPANFTLTNTAATVTISATSGASQSVKIGQPYATMTATVLSGGNPAANVSVTFTAPGSGPSGTFTGGALTATVQTNAQGVATAPAFTANGTLGSFTVSATTSGAGSPATFNLTNLAGDPFSITAITGTPQQAEFGTQFPLPFTVEVRDAGGNPVGGATVTFTAPGFGASGSFQNGQNTAVTGSNGRATSAGFVANSTAGSYIVSASTNGLPPAQFSLTNVSPGSGGPQITIPSVLVGENLQTLITVTIPTPAPQGGVRITLQSSDSSKVRIAGRVADAGTDTLQATVLEGLTSVSGIFVQGMSSAGTATITASASGFTSGIGTVTLTPSGFVLSGPNGAAGSIQVYQGESPTLTVSSARLDTSFNFVELQQIRGGMSITAPLTTSTPSVGSITPPSVTFNSGDTQVTTTFAASASATGATTVTVPAPSGFSTPASGVNSLSITVLPAALVAPAVTVGQNLQATANITFNSPVPGSSTLPTTITSGDPTRVLFATSPSGPGTASIVLDVPPGRRTSQDFYVFGLQSGGTVSYSVTAPGYGSASGAVTLRSSAFVLSSPFGRGADFFTTTGAPDSDLVVFSAMLDAGGNVAALQPVRGGFTANVGVVSGTPSIGTITVSPVVIVGPADSGLTAFHPLTAGNSVISLTQPAGFVAPPTGGALTARVSTPQINVGTLTVGKNLQAVGTILLGQPAPAGGLNVTLTSGAPGLLLLSPNETTAGSASVVINVPAGNLSALYVAQGLADSGISSFTATAPGYGTGSGTVTLVPSGVVIAGPFGLGFGLTTSVAAGPQPVTISTARLDPSAGNVFAEIQSLAAGKTLAVTITNSVAGIGNIASSVTISGGTSDAVTNFTPVANGQTTLGVLQPPGYTAPTPNPANYTSVLARVQ